MIAEVKTIYHSMLTTKKYDQMVNKLPTYAIDVVRYYDKILDLDMSELDNVKNLLHAMIIKSYYKDVKTKPTTKSFIKKVLKELGL